MQKMHDKINFICKIFAIQSKTLIHLQLAASAFRYYLCAHLKTLICDRPILF